MNLKQSTLKRKLSRYISSIDNFDSRSDADKVIILSFFHTEIQKAIEITTEDLRLLYNLLDLPAPTNFGGEIRSLRKTKKLIKTKNGYKLSRSAKEGLTSQIKNSKILPAHNKLQPVLSFDLLHPIIQEVSKGLFKDGHYSPAIFEAFKAVVNEVKRASNVNNLDGKPLMELVFSVNNPILKFNNLQTQSEKDEQIGLMFLFSGAALGIRNPKAHDYIVQKDPIRALEYLNFASLLLKRLDEKLP